MTGLRLIAAAALVLPVGVVMLSAGLICLGLTAALWPLAWIRNRAREVLGALLLEVFRP